MQGQLPERAGVVGAQARVEDRGDEAALAHSKKECLSSKEARPGSRGKSPECGICAVALLGDLHTLCCQLSNCSKQLVRSFRLPACGVGHVVGVSFGESAVG